MTTTKTTTRRARARRGDYYPDTMSPSAREVLQSASNLRFWQDWAGQGKTGGMLDLAEDVMRWHAGELIATSTGTPPRRLFSDAEARHLVNVAAGRA